jgi:parallel beta-helix repeat protein
VLLKFLYLEQIILRIKRKVELLRKTVSGIMLSLLVISTLTSTFNIQPVKASGTIYIRPDGSIDPLTTPIQRDGDIYTLTANITTDIDGIVIERDNITLDGAGYTVQGTHYNNSKGIYLNGRSNVTIRNMEIKGFSSLYLGNIYVIYCDNVTITGNIILNSRKVSNDTIGIGVAYSSNVIIQDCNISDNGRFGIRFCYSNKSIVKDCKFSNNWQGIACARSRETIIRNVDIRGGPVGSLPDILNSTYPHPWCTGTGVQVSDHTIIEHCNIAYYFLDMYIQGDSANPEIGSNNTISYCNLSYAVQALTFQESANNVISNNIISDSDTGLIFIAAPTNKARNNTLLNNTCALFMSEEGLIIRPINYIQDIDASNTANGKPVYYLIGRSNETIDGKSMNIGYLGLISSNNVTIRNLNISNNGDGTFLANVTDSILEDSQFMENIQGVHLTFCTNNTIRHVNASTNYQGFFVFASTNNTISHCNIVNNGIGVNLAEDSENNRIQYCNLSNNSVGIWSLMNPYYVHQELRITPMSNPHHNTVQYCTMSSNFYGYGSINSSYNTIEHCDFFACMQACILEKNSSYNLIQYCNISKNPYGGIGISESFSNTIQYCTFSDNYDPKYFHAAVYMGDDSYLNTVQFCDIHGSYVGIAFLGGNYNVIQYSNISGNLEVYPWTMAIGFYEASNSNNIIRNNNIWKSFWGIYFYPSNSTDNTIYHNNFINNTINARCYNLTNIWDNGYPSGGNHWSDYVGTDLYNGPFQNETGSDGMGDTPYIIDSNNKDHHPLMKPWVWEAPIALGSHSPSIHTNVIAFPRPDGSILYYDISKETVTNTLIDGSLYAAIYKDIIAFPRVGWGIALYNICTDGLNYVTTPDPLDIFDLVLWAGRAPCRYIAIYNSTIAFYDSAGTWYYNISSSTWTKITSTPAYGVSVYGNIIAFSDGTTIKYYNITSGTTTDTGASGINPTIYENIVAFEFGTSIRYYNLTSGSTTNTMVAGCHASVYGDIISFYTNETWIGTDLNGDGDLLDEVIRYYEISTNTTINTKQVGKLPSIHNDVITFITKEADLGIDINNDADTNDWVVRFKVLHRDIAVNVVTPSKTVVGQGCSLNINVTAANQGARTETFNVTLYANTTSITTQTVTLTSGNSTTITFTWNTTGFAKGNYTISAYAWPVLGETDTADNTLPDGWVVVAMVGDITGPSGWPDGKVDMIYDIRTVAKLFGAAPPDPRYNPNYDINGDGVIDMINDIRTVAKQFGKTDP